MCNRNDLMHDASGVEYGFSGGAVVETPPPTRLFVPGVPESANRWSRHWQGRHRERNRWRDAVRVAVIRATPRPQPVAGPFSCTLTFYFPDRIHRDPDNATKLVLDGVKLAGLIRDDGPPWLVELVLRPRLVPAGHEPGVMVEITPESAPAWPIPVRRGTNNVRGIVPRET